TNHPMKRHQRRAMERAADVEAVVVETLGAIQAIKASRAEPRMQLRLEARFAEMLEATYQSQLLGVRSSAASSLISGASTLMLLWYGGHLVIQGAVSVGQLMAFNSL